MRARGRGRGRGRQRQRQRQRGREGGRDSERLREREGEGRGARKRGMLCMLHSMCTQSGLRLFCIIYTATPVACTLQFTETLHMILSFMRVTHATRFVQFSRTTCFTHVTWFTHVTQTLFTHDSQMMLRVCRLRKLENIYACNPGFTQDLNSLRGLRILNFCLRMLHMLRVVQFADAQSLRDGATIGVADPPAGGAVIIIILALFNAGDIGNF